jgi:hypothetical protein
MSAFMLIQKSPQRSRLEFLRACDISLKGSLQLSLFNHYKLVYTQKQENTKNSMDVPGSNKQGGDEGFQSLTWGYLTIIRAIPKVAIWKTQQIRTVFV